MLNWKYIATVVIITAIILSIGGILWNKDTIELEPLIVSASQTDITAIQPGTTTEPQVNITTTPPPATPAETGPDMTAGPEPDSVNSSMTVRDRGNPEAPVTIEVFPDFGCHICVEKEVLILQALKDYPGKIYVIYNHFPSSGFDEKLAESLEAAGEQGKFWEMHDRLVQDVPGDIVALLAAAQITGLDLELFNTALESGKYTETVRKSKEDAIARGVKSVSMFINGTKYTESSGALEDLYKAIDKELAKVKTDG